MLRPTHCLGLLVAAITPVVVLACGDDDTSSNTSSTPDGAAPVVPPGTGPTTEDAGPPPPPAPISVHVGTTGATAAFVVFYPKESPDQPVVKTIADNETVSNVSAGGADVIFAAVLGPSAIVIQLDAVTPGENLSLVPAPPTAPTELPVSTSPGSVDGATEYLLSSCTGVAPSPTAAITTTFSSRCIEAGNKARFLMTARAGGSSILAIASAVVTPAAAGTTALPLTWTTPTPTPWPISGSAPGTDIYDFGVDAVDSTTGFSFPLFARAAFVPPADMHFLRAPAGFNDRELRRVALRFEAMVEGVATTTRLVLTETTSASMAVPPTDLSTLGPHFLTAGMTNDGTPSFDFTASGAFPATSTFVGDASMTLTDRVVSWKVISPKLAAGHVPARVLPDAVRTAVIPTTTTWKFGSGSGTSGVDTAYVRANLSALVGGADNSLKSKTDIRIVTNTIFPP